MTLKRFLLLGGLCLISVCGHSAENALFLAARPVWAEGRRDSQNSFISFRANFNWRGGSRPLLRVTGSTIYRASVNGIFVGYGPARTAPGFARVDEWPLAVATNGVNEVVVEACSYNVPNSYQYLTAPGFLQAEVVADGRALAATPGDFSATELPRDGRTPFYSHQRKFPTERWTVGGQVAALPLETVPGVRLLPRGVPYPEFKLNRAFMLRSDGKTYELPFVDTGFAGVKVRCSTPARVTFRFEEALVDGKLDLGRNGDPETSWHAMHNVVTWELREPGDYTLESIEPYTMKYAEVRLESGEGEVSSLWLRQYRNPYPEQVSFKSSDPELDAIFAAACNSLAQNAVDLYTDCPSRERSAWLCDSRFTAEAAAWLTGDNSIEGAQLENYALTKEYPGLPPGAMSGLYPGNDLVPTYILWYVLQCGDHVARAGADADRFREAVKERIAGNIAYLEQYENADGLLENLPGWVFIEWSKANDLTAGVNYPANALWSGALDCAGRLYGRADWTEKARKVRAAVRRQSFDGRYFRDHAVRDKKGNLLARPDRTETCQYYQFYFNVATPESHPDLWMRMTTDFGPGRTADGLFPSAILFGRFLRLELFARIGRRQQIVDEVKLYFGKMARESGTLWEFDDGHDSRCHAFGSYVAVILLRDILGLKPDWLSRGRIVLDDPNSPIRHCELQFGQPDARFVDAFDLSEFPCGQGKRVQANKSVDGHALTVGGVTYQHGFGTRPESAVAFTANGGPLSFTARVAIDDDAAKAGSGKSYGQPMATFAVWADGKVVWRSGYVKLGQKPVEAEVKLDGAKEIVLETSGGAQWTALDAANADWLDARFTLGKGTEIAPLVDPARFRQPGVLTPSEKEEPQINGADIFGVRPGHPVIFRIATSGVRPMRFTADGLPEGVTLDGAKGVLRGTAPLKAGDYDVVVTAENAKGRATRTIRLAVGEKIALTPPMGWNSWNVWENRLTQANALASAEAMDRSGLGDHGWSYVNLDDFWEMNNEKCPPERPELKGPARNADGTIRPNPSFPDMKGLTDAIHALGFKAGLYSSPGRITCGGCTGSLGHEMQDATSWAEWGFDYVKYDWCSYWEVFSKETGGRNMWDQACYDDLAIRESYVKPYRLMGECLKKQKRDILFSLCQYGMAHVEDWGASVGANCWRSWEDLKDSWHWLELAIESRIGAHYEKYSRPGCWADPDMMIVGRQFSFGSDHPTFLTPAEQYTHVTLWAMVGAPMLVGCDLAELDAFTRNLLVNDEVIAISQDRLGKVARRIRHTDAESVWVRDLANGDIAVALVNRAPISHEIRVDFAAVGLEGVHYLRDCWTQRCEGRHAGFYVAEVPPHGVKLIRVKAKNCQKCDDEELDGAAIGIRDPFVLVENGKYYLYDSAQGETKGVFVRTGTSIRKWSRREQVMTLPPDVPVTDVWAPEVHKFNGRYYLFVTITEKKGTRLVAKSVRNSSSVLPRGTWVFVANSPLGPFEPVRRGPVPKATDMTLDGTLYVENGKPYMVYCHEWMQIGSGTIEYAPLADDLSRLTAPPRKILSAREALKGAEDVTDGPFLYRSSESGTLYLIWSNFIEGRGYCVLVRKSLSGKIAGPWSKDEILTGNDGGHGMIFRTVEGELLMALHRPNGAARLAFERLKESNGMLRCMNEEAR